MIRQARWMMVMLAGCGSNAVIDVQGPPLAFDDNVLECELPILCPTLSYQDYAPPNTPGLPSPDAYDCALAALRGRTPSILVVSDGCEGTCAGNVYLLKGDGTALRQPWFTAELGQELDGMMVDFSAWDTLGATCTMKPSSFFDTCDSAYLGDCWDDGQWFVDCSAPPTQNCRE